MAEFSFRFSKFLAADNKKSPEAICSRASVSYSSWTGWSYASTIATAALATVIAEEIATMIVTVRFMSAKLGQNSGKPLEKPEFG